MRRKLLSILALLLIAAGSAWAERVNVTFSANGKSIVKEKVELEHTYWCHYSLRDGELDEIIRYLYDFEDGFCWVVWVAPSASGSNITAGKGDSSGEDPEYYNDMYITLAEGFKGPATVTCQYDKVTKYWEETMGDWSENYEDYDITLTITATPIIDVTSVSLPASATLDVGGTTTLTATVTPGNATDKTVTWSSSNPSVATVSNSGVVTAVATGSATITATATNGTADTSDDKTATCAVTVNTVAVTGVTLPASSTLNVGQSTTLTATIAPSYATNKSVTWTTSDASVATVSNNGVVTAVGLGTATITVTTTDGGYTATCTVTVATPINAVSEDGTIGAFTDANGQTRLGIVVTLNGNKYAISMNEETDLSGLSGTYTKKVGSHTYYNQADACQKFANNKADGSYNVANVWRLPTATEMSYLVALGGSRWDGTAGHQGYTWTIGSNSLFLPAAGYYDYGVVTNSESWGYYWTSGGGTGNMLCFANGNLLITNGGTSSGMPLRLFCQLPYTAVSGVTLSATEATMAVGGETLTLTATVSPDNATDKTVTWTTSDDAVATVSNGVVTAVGLGSATITATATNGTANPSDDVTATCIVTVVTPINSVSEDGAIGTFTDANGQTRMGIVVTLNGNKYAISMNEETDLSGLSGTNTKKVGSHTYYNQADACQKFANNKTDGTYNVANVWRLPTTTEMSYLVALGGSAWDGTEGHQGYTWTIGSNTLFLPAAGYYEGGVASSDWGYYWTSGGGTGNMLCFTSWYTAAVGNGGTTSGMPLRLFCQLPYTAVSGVTLSATEATLIVGETTTLTPTVAPATATDMTVTWTTSDDAVATVTDGVVTAVGAGTATITVTATNGTADTSDDKTATCTVTVNYPTYDLTANEETGDLSGLNDYKGKTCTVTYARSFTADKPSTLCLPFAFPTASANGKFYTFSDITKEGTEYIADMTQYTGMNLVANVPYLYKANATGSVDFSGTYEIPNPLTAGSTESNGWTFKGTYETISWTEAPTGIYGFSAQNVDEQGISQGQFVKVGEYVRIRPMRCYLENESFARARGMNRAAADEPLPETIKVRLISANGDVTGIGSLQTKTGEVTMDGEAWYSIDGRRIEGKPSTKGIYLNNGKKVVIK